MNHSTDSERINERAKNNDTNIGFITPIHRFIEFVYQEKITM